MKGVNNGKVSANRKGQLKSRYVVAPETYACAIKCSICPSSTISWELKWPLSHLLATLTSCSADHVQKVQKPSGVSLNWQTNQLLSQLQVPATTRKLLFMKKLVNEKMLLQLTSNVLAIWYCTLMMQNVIRLHNVYISPHFKQCPWQWKETKHRSYLGVVRFSIWQQWWTASNVQQLITSLLRTSITFLNAVPKLR